MASITRIEPRLHVNDLRRAIDFYTHVLGFSLDTLFPDEDPIFAMLSRDGVGIQLGGIDAQREPSQRSTCTLWIDVEDVHRLHREIARVVPIEWGPEVFFYGRREFAFFDPDGNLVVLSEETDDPVTERE